MTESKRFLPVDAAYDRWAGFYDGYDNPMVRMAAAVVERRLAGLSGLDVFEFGCGTGRNLMAMRRAGAATVAGCDISEGMLAVARARDGEFELSLTDMRGGVRWPDDSADLVLFCLTLEHIEDLMPPLREACRLLRRQGRVEVIEIHPFLSLQGKAAHFHDAGEEVRMPVYAHQFAAYLRAFRLAGLAVDECREWRPLDVDAAAGIEKMAGAAANPMAVEFVLTRDTAALRQA